MNDKEKALEALDRITRWAVDNTEHFSVAVDAIGKEIETIRAALEQRVPDGVSDLYSVEWFKRNTDQFEATIWPDPENPIGGLGDTPMAAIRDALAAAPEPEDVGQ